MHPTHHAGITPDKPALIMAQSGETLTYRQLDALSNQGAQLFRKLGLATGDAIAIFMENNLAFLPVCWHQWTVFSHRPTPVTGSNTGPATWLVVGTS